MRRRMRGIKTSDIDGMLSYSNNDSTPRHLHGRRPFRAVEFLHGLLWRRILDRSYQIGIAIGVMESRSMQLRGDLPSYERLFSIFASVAPAREQRPRLAGRCCIISAYGFQSAQARCSPPSFIPRHMYDYPERDRNKWPW